MTTLIADILTLLGVFGATVAVAGVARSRSVYVQIHASTLLIMAGAIVVLAAALTTGKADIIGRSILVAGFLILTAPVSSHAIARLHYIIGDDARRNPPAPDQNPNQDANQDADQDEASGPSHTSGASPA